MPNFMRRCAPVVVTMVVLAVAVIPAAGQGTPASPAAPLSVFLDCRTSCDMDLIRTEVTYVNWVRDRAVADVHVLVTSQEAGAGGQAITIAFLGLRAFAGRGDTLVYTTNPTTTSDERRRGVTRTITLGLVPFLARTSMAHALRISRSGEGDVVAVSQTAPANDPWRAWVFEIGLNGFTNGESSYKQRELESSFEARRVTEAWKHEFEFDFRYRDERVTEREFDSVGAVVAETTYKNLQRNWSGELLSVKSVSNHLSLGTRLSVQSSRFRNQKLNMQLLAAAEYNIFPYSENTRRELVFRYGAGFNSFRYQDTTIFDKLRETLAVHFVESSFQSRQPWGSASITASHWAYMRDASKRRTELNGNLNVRLFRGFSVNFGGGYNWIRDQLYIPKGGGDQIDVLLRRRALLTGYEYFGHFGVSYTFGSIFNNVVNPRF